MQLKYIGFQLLEYKREEDENKPINRELHPITAAESVDYCTPEVFWYQTETAVRISVKLSNTTECHISLAKNRIINFK